MTNHSAASENKALIGIIISIVCIVGVIAVLRFDATGEKGSGLGSDFEYNIEELSKIDPNLIIFKDSASPINTGFSVTHAIAVDKTGAIYVSGDNSIRKFDDKGTKLDEIKLKAEPQCLAIVNEQTGEDEQNSLTIYVGLKDHVEIYQSGKLIKTWQSLGDKAVLTSIAVSDEDVFVADAGNRVVIRFDKDGNIVNKIGEKDQSRNISGFVIPSPYFDLAVGRDGLLRVANPGKQCIEAYTFAGDLEFSWGEYSNKIEGFCGCCNPVNFAILYGDDPSGDNDRFITCEKGLTRVKVYDNEGKFVGVVAGPAQLIEGGKVEVCDSPEECQMGGFDVAVDSTGRVIVLDTIENTIRIFSSIEK
ncbi:MAG: hypothetical protein JW787_05590 [Sedimentisphaerales bacterium]|nr:hypothetical protein [Sedimentisphaerales bacterium]